MSAIWRPGREDRGRRAVDDRRCVLTSGSDSLDAIALHLALLDVPFTPIEPPELRDRCQALAARLLQAAARY